MRNAKMDTKALGAKHASQFWLLSERSLNSVGRLLFTIMVVEVLALVSTSVSHASATAASALCTTVTIVALLKKKRALSAVTTNRHPGSWMHAMSCAAGQRFRNGLKTEIQNLTTGRSRAVL